MAKPKGYDSFKSKLGRTPRKLSRTLWDGSFYYRESDDKWVEKDTGKTYKNIRKNMYGHYEGV